MKDSRLIKLIHDLTQKGLDVKFCNDFRGMLTLAVFKGEILLEHRHLGTPHGPLKDVEKAVRNTLAEFFEKEDYVD